MQRSEDKVPADIGCLRQTLENIDRQLLDLFALRMRAARAMASAKAASGATVYDPAREDENVARALAAADPANARLVESLLRGIMRLSRNVQYECLLESGADFPLGRLLLDAPSVWPAVRTVVFQGTVGSYSEQACTHLFPGVATVRAATFAEACDRVHEDAADAAVLPLENSTAGTVDDVYDLLLQHQLFIWRSLSLPISHHLLALPGTRLADIRTVLSHPQALAQCSDIIRQQGWTAQETLNTAFAAETVAAGGDRHLAAIASAPAAAAFGLEILRSGINNVQANQTRFIVIGKKLVITPDAGRVSLILSLPHRIGSLASTLAVFSDRGLNLIKIQSRPNLQNPWTYLFYLDFESRCQDRQQTLSTLYQLSREMPFLRLLGWYGEVLPNQEEAGLAR